MPSLLDRINRDLDDMLGTPGITNIAERMVVAFGGTVEQYTPYILAAVMEFNVASMADMKDDPFGWVMEIEGKLPKAMAHAAVASERIGINWRERGKDVGIQWPEGMEHVNSVSEMLAEMPVGEESTDDWPIN